MATAVALYERGVTVQGLSDIDWEVSAPEGIDMPAARALVQSEGSLEHVPGARPTTHTLLSWSADIVVPAAASSQIRANNAADIIESGTTHGEPKIICEAANGASTFHGGELLEEAQLHVVPDVLANPGGVVGSYFEMLQNQEGRAWTLEETTGRLHETMNAAYDNARATASHYGISLRMGAVTGAVVALAQEAASRLR